MRTTGKSKKYTGINNDPHHGMTVIGRIIRDAWVFGLLPEDQTCEDWEMSRIEALHQQVNNEWDKYGCMVSHLPEDLRERHSQIHGAALEKAKAAGWSGEIETDNEG